MKSYQIRVNDQEYQVEIADLTTRPIRVQVDGEWFDVWPEEITQTIPAPRVPPAALPHPSPTPREDAPAKNAPAENGTPSGSGRVVRSPLPGVVTVVHVQPGDEIAPGQPLCVVEAMKMNNVIRANQTGKVAALRVAIGQHVKHHDVLVELM